MLRYDGPVPATMKIATEPVTWHGRRIEPGEVVLPCLSSANRDPRQFPDPDRFDVRRTPNRHLAFAFGIHFCLGAPLARLEARLAFETLLRRCSGLELAGDDLPPWKPQIFLRGLASLPLRCAAGSTRRAWRGAGA
jgi:cytochrome P450